MDAKQIMGLIERAKFRINFNIQEIEQLLADNLKVTAELGNLVKYLEIINKKKKKEED